MRKETFGILHLIINHALNFLTSRFLMIVTIILLSDTNTNVECSTFSEDYKFDCQGHFSKLTYQDCQGNFFNTTGCYFLENFAQYRACASICNDVIEGSLDEEKCRLYCPGKETEYTPCHMYVISMQI